MARMRATHLAIIALSLAAPVAAQPVAGPYLRLSAGLDLLGRNDLDIFGRRASVGFSRGAVGMAAAGWGLGRGFLLEAEGQAGGNDVKQVLRNGSATRSGGAVARQAIMLNLLYERAIPGLPRLRPYVGAGIGAGWNSWQRVSGLSVGGDGGRLTVQGNRGGFAWQAMLGLEVALPELLPGLSAGIGYRHIDGTSRRFPITFVPGRGSTTRGDTRTEGRNDVVLLSLRYQFR